MEDLVIEGRPFYEIQNPPVHLFHGQYLAGGRPPVVVWHHDFDRNNTQGIDQHLNAALAQAKVRHPYYCNPSEICFQLSGEKYRFSYILENPQTEEKKPFTKMALQGLLLSTSTQFEWVSDIKYNYDIEENPFLTKTGVKYYRGVAKKGKPVDIILKQYDFSNVAAAETQKNISRCLNSAFVQVQHPHCCALFEILMRFDGENCSVYHVLERLPSDINTDITDRKREHRLYTEPELREFLRQASEALAYSHSQHTTHGDLQCGTFQRIGDRYKILDLSCHFTEMALGESAHAYESGTMTELKSRNTPIKAMKVDVYALGSIVMAMAKFDSPDNPSLPYSPQFNALVSSMLASDEASRPTMQEIHQQMTYTFATFERLMQESQNAAERANQLQAKIATCEAEITAIKRERKEKETEIHELRNIIVKAAASEKEQLRAFRERKNELESLYLEFGRLCERMRVEESPMEEALRVSRMQGNRFEMRESAEHSDQRMTSEDLESSAEAYAEKDKTQEMLQVEPPKEPVALVVLNVESHSADIVNSEYILQSFPSDQPFYPVFIIGSQGKSTLLESLISNQASCESKESDPDGVYFWPQPIALGEVSLLCLKFRREAVDDAAHLEFRKRIKAVFMALTSVWCICEDSRDGAIQAMESFVQDYEEIQRIYGVKLSKVFVFVEEAWIQRPSDRKRVTDLQSKNPGVFEIRYRGAQGSKNDRTHLANFASELGQAALHSPYLETHADVFQGNCRERYFTLLNALTKIASLNLTFSTFFTKLPNLRASDEAINLQLKQLKQVADNAALIQSQGSALSFVTQQEVGSELVKFDESIMEKLQKTFRVNEATIVLAVMSSPGLGKSTLLNHIIQRCTESPQVPSIFATGSSGVRITVNSQVFSHPLFLRNSQLMLIDLESLGSAEQMSEAQIACRQSVVNAIMAISSVLAIIVTNEVQKLLEMKSSVAQLAKLHRKHGYVTERVFLLFHDKGRDAGINSHFAEAVSEMNAEFFDGREVVRILNKPNFMLSEQEPVEFVDTFLTGCLFPKLTADRSAFIDLRSLLTELSVIAQSRLHSLEEVELMLPQATEYKEIIAPKLRKLKNIYAAIISADDASLVVYFQTTLESSYYPSLKQQLAGMPSNIVNRCNTRIELEVKKLTAKLEILERCYAVVKAYSEEHLCKIVDEWLYFQYKSEWYFGSFITAAGKFGKKLRNLKQHFSFGSEKLDAMLEHFRSKRLWMTAKSFGHSVAHAAKSVAETVVRRNLTHEEEKVTGGICSTALIMKKADELISISSWRHRGEINTTIRTLFEEPPTEPALALLFIGAKSTSLATFANSFVRHISPFTPLEFDAVHSEKYTQFLSFRYSHPTGTCRAFVICLRMKKKETSRYSEMMQSIAEALLPAASLTCLLSDRAQTYADLVLKMIHSSPRVENSDFPERKLIVLHSQEGTKEYMLQLTQQLPVRCTVKVLPGFTNETILENMEAVKREIDTVQMRDSGVLWQQISKLTAIVEGSSI